MSVVEVVPLPWDSAVLGQSVARATVAGLEASAVRALLTEIRQRDLALTYLFGHPADTDAGTLLREAGAALVDERTTYVRPVDPQLAGHIPEGVVSFAGPWPDAELRALGIASGQYSRFRTDPRMPRHVFEQIYEAWVARSVAGEIADIVYVYREGTQTPARCLGLVTVGVANGRADIGLLAVAPEARGRGTGRALVRAAGAWAAARGVSVEQVVTQGSNAPARRLYESSGYRVESVIPVYHLWLDR